jgi:hypothetical protein
MPHFGPAKLFRNLNPEFQANKDGDKFVPKFLSADMHNFNYYLYPQEDVPRSSKLKCILKIFSA